MVGNLKLIFTLLLLLTNSITFASAEKTQKKIEFVKTYIKENHLKDYRSLARWMKSDKSAARPRISPKLQKAIKHLGRLYKEYLAEKKFTSEKQREIFEKKMDYYNEMSSFYSRDINPYHKNFLVTAGYLHIWDTINISGPGINLKKEESFNAAVLGGAWYSHPKPHFWRIDGELFIGRGDVRDGSLNYQDDSISLRGLTIIPSFGYSLYENIYLTFGVPLTFSSLAANRQNDLESQTYRTRKIGIEARAGYIFRNDFVTEVRAGKMERGSYVSLQLGYQL